MLSYCICCLLVVKVIAVVAVVVTVFNKYPMANNMKAFLGVCVTLILIC